MFVIDLFSVAAAAMLVFLGGEPERKMSPVSISAGALLLVDARSSGCGRVQSASFVVQY